MEKPSRYAYRFAERMLARPLRAIRSKPGPVFSLFTKLCLSHPMQLAVLKTAELSLSSVSRDPIKTVSSNGGNRRVYASARSQSQGLYSSPRLSPIGLFVL